MRTTLRIDDDVMRAAQSLARAEKKAIGKVISDLARRALSPRAGRRRGDGFPTFEVNRNAPPVTWEMVRDALEDD